MADARKSLPQLRNEWASCVACDLGHRRISMEGHFVFGEGALRSIMLVGEGPAEAEEEVGRPFAGPSGVYLRKVLKILGMTEEVYMTHVVCCRACSPQLDADNNPRFRKDYKKGGPPIMQFRDEVPTPVQWQACLARLHEEIYIVDPIVIVGMGSTACTALLQRHFTISKERGIPGRISIPGAAHVPVFTEKRHEWVRKRAGALEQPTELNQVHYFFIPTLHPGAVLAKIADKHPDSNSQKFLGDMLQAKTIYNKYVSMALGIDLDEQKSISMEALYTQVNEEEP